MFGRSSVRCRLHETEAIRVEALLDDQGAEERFRGGFKREEDLLDGVDHFEGELAGEVCSVRLNVRIILDWFVMGNHVYPSCTSPSPDSCVAMRCSLRTLVWWKISTNPLSTSMWRWLAKLSVPLNDRPAIFVNRRASKDDFKLIAFSAWLESFRVG